MEIGRRLLAEMMGTFLLCFAGISAIIGTFAPIESGAGLVGIALAHGLALSIGVAVFGGISGAHFNPAVTIGFLSVGRIPALEAVQYIIAQLIGASVASLACKTIFPVEAVAAANLGIPLPQDWVTPTILIVTEIILTFLLMTAIYGTAVDARGKAVKIGGFGIGLMVTADILAGGPITGASMNPARSFGPALVQGHFDYHIYYWIAPIIGAVAAALVYEYILLGEDNDG